MKYILLKCNYGGDISECSPMICGIYDDVDHAYADAKTDMLIQIDIRQDGSVADYEKMTIYSQQSKKGCSWNIEFVEFPSGNVL